MTTFDELFAEHNLTPEERKALVMHLATLRAQKTVATLQDCPHAAPQPAALPELSDAEIGRLVDRMDNTHDSDLLKFARAVIAAMKGKQ